MTDDADKDKRKSQEDALWVAAISDVKPFEKKEEERVVRKTPKKEQDRRPLSPVGTKRPGPGVIKDSVKDKVAPDYDFAGIDRRTDEKLRRGKFKIEASLDLHGMNRIEAQSALRLFLSESYESGKRAVLIVTGKGSREGSGVIKQNFPSWVEEGALRQMVLQYYPAQPKDGGNGAFYVLLRRKR